MKRILFSLLCIAAGYGGVFAQGTVTPSTTTPCAGDPGFTIQIDWESRIQDIHFEFSGDTPHLTAAPTIDLIEGRAAVLHFPWATSMIGKAITVLVIFDSHDGIITPWRERKIPVDLTFVPLPTIQGSVSTTGGSYLRTNTPYGFVVLGTSSGVQSRRWYIDNVLQPVTGGYVNLTFTSVGTHIVECKPVNSCGQEGVGISRSVTVYCEPAGFRIEGPQYICPDADGIDLDAVSELTNGTYSWTRDGQSFAGNNVKKIKVTQPGIYKVQASFPNGCVGELTQTVQNSSPPVFPVTSVIGLKSNFSDEVTPLEVVGGNDATDFDWDVANSTSGKFDDANGRVLKQKVRFTPEVAGNLTVVVTPLKNTCRGASFELPFESISEGWKNTDTLVMHHNDLNVAGGTTGYLYLPKHSPNYDGCFEQLGPVTLNISLDLGKYYNLGKNQFKSDVTIAVTPYSDVSGAGETWTFPLHIDQNAPEQLFSKRIILDPARIRFFKIFASGYNTSVQAAANLIRLAANFQEEDIVDVSGVTLTLAKPSQDQTNRRWEQTFNWTTSCPDVPDYIFQLLKQDGDAPPEPGKADPSEWSEATWKNALLIQTESGIPSVTLSMGEGSGLYYWRVTALGNKPGGITNPENWGTRHYGLPLDYKHPEANKNWIYSRTFAEGNKVSEQVTYANGLSQAAQSVTRIQGQNRIVAAQTLQDYIGRNAVASLPIPVAEVASLQYIDKLLANGTGVQTRPYRAHDFDSLNIPAPAYERGKYYSGTLVKNEKNEPENDRVASAEGYPFSQTFFTTDGTGRVREQAGVGLKHSKAGGKTIRNFYDTPSEGELVSLFGSEAPAANSVQKIITYDANNVASVTYQSKDGKVIATALTLTGDNSLPLDPLKNLSPTDYFEVVKNNQRVDDFTVVSRKPLFLTKTGSVEVNYEITPAQLRELCSGSSNNSLVAYYPLDRDVQDQSGHRNHGAAASGAVPDATSGRPGAYTLNGNTNGYIQVADGPDFDFGSSDFSVAYWVKKTNSLLTGWKNAPGVHKWNSVDAPGTNEWGLLLRSTQNTSSAPGFYLESDQSVIYKAIADVTLAAGTWYHLAGVRQGNLLKIYINGRLAGTSIPMPTGTRANNIGRALEIGRMGANYTAGSFDEVQVYRKALSETEIKQLMGGTTLCTTCDYTVSFKFLKEGVPAQGVMIPSKIISAGACSEQADRKYTTTFNLPLEGGVNYTLEKYLTLNNKVADQPGKTQLDIAKAAVASTYRNQLTARLTTINSHIANRDFEALNDYLDDVATYDESNNRYVLPLLPPGTDGCQQFIYIPKAAVCPKEEVDEATCKMIVSDRPEDRLSFEEYFENYYVNRPEITVPGNGTLEYLYFTNQFLPGNKEQYFPAGKFNEMVTNLIHDNAQLTKQNVETACQRVWRIWKTEVIAYEENLKYKLPTETDLSDFGNAVPAKFSLLQNFLRALDSDLQSVLVEGEDMCTPGVNRPPFIIRDVLYGRFGPATSQETINNIPDNQASAAAPDLAYAYKLVYYDATIQNMKQVFQFYANITDPSPEDPQKLRDPILTDFKGMQPCDRYKMSQSTNMGDQGFSTTPEDVQELIDANLEKQRRACGKACEGRAEEFRQAVIDALLRNSPTATIEHYRVRRDVTYRNGVWIGVLDSTMNKTGYTFSQCELEESINALIENCKNNYCTTTLTPYDSTIFGRLHRVYGTPEQRLNLTKPVAYNFKIEAGSTCGSGWDAIAAQQSSSGFLKKTLLEGAFGGAVYRMDAVGNHFVLAPISANRQVAIKERSGNILYFSNNDGVEDLLVAKFDNEGELLWSRHLQVRPSQAQAARASTANAPNSQASASVFNISADGNILFSNGFFSIAQVDVFLGGNLIKTATPMGWNTLSGKFDSNGNLIWSSIDDLEGANAHFLEEDSQGNSYTLDTEGRVVKHDVSGNFVWRSDLIRLYNPNEGSNWTYPKIKVDATGNVYVAIDASAVTSLKVFRNGTQIESLASKHAILFYRFDTNGQYVWHNAYESTQEVQDKDYAISADQNSVYFVYSKRLVDQLMYSTELGIDYSVSSYPNRLVYAQINAAKTVLNKFYFDNSAPILSIADPVSNSNDRNIDYLAFNNVNYRWGFVSFNKNSKVFSNLSEKNIGFYISSFFVSGDGKFEFLLQGTGSPFTANGSPLYSYSTAGSMDILFKDIQANTCGRPGICFQFTTPRFQEVKVPDHMDSLVYNPQIIPCEESTATELRNAIDLQVEQIVNARVASFGRQYLSTCGDPALINDKLTIKRTEGLYQFTLYYYDRAGNLVRTVPPEGIIKLLPVGTDSDIAASKTKLPEQKLVTEYQYNSLGQLIRQHTPDGNYGLAYIYSNGTTTATPIAGFTKPTATDGASLDASKYYSTYIFNDNGQLRFARNAQQKLDGTYSYTKYDVLGRVIEVGEAAAYDETEVMRGRNDVGIEAYPTNGARSVTRTIYNELYNHDGADEQHWPSGYEQEQTNLRNRVSYSYVDKDGLDQPSPNDRTYTIYDYDVHGNVRWLVQIMPELPAVAIHYEYDLLTQKVNQVSFNPSKPREQFYHRYQYDASNRIKSVQTSKDGHLWETDAAYSYYLHGPLQRMTLGEDLLQGVDYTYTISGWTKGVNHGLMDKTSDPGKDASATSVVARDAFGMSLSYFGGDYKFEGSLLAESSPGNIKPDRDLYNGNISASTSNALYPTGSITEYPQLTGNQYTYDMLNRLLTSRLQPYAAGAFKDAPNKHFFSRYTYDRNGNIDSTINHRGSDGNGNPMDILAFNYASTTPTNRLNYVNDAAAANAFGSDLEPGQKSHNYRYDAIGNLTYDKQQEVEVIWNAYGKVERVKRKVGTDAYDVTDFSYDAAGNRVIKKRTNPSGLVVSNYYVRDGAGNIMAVYERTEQINQPVETVITEIPIYGSGRLGTYSRTVQTTNFQDGQTEAEGDEVRISQSDTKNSYEGKSYLLNSRVELTLGPGFAFEPADAASIFRIRAGVTVNEESPGASDIFTRSLNSRRYQMSDHLGNVRSTITDIKLSTISGNTQTDYHPDLVGVSNYYSFGMEMPGRTWTSGEKYRYGFNGKEKDDNGEWGSTAYDYGFRVYNPSIGRFLSVDPLTSQYAELTPYQFASNKPINSIDLDGLESRTSIKGKLVDGCWTMGSDNHIAIVDEEDMRNQAQQNLINAFKPNYGTLRNTDITSTTQYKFQKQMINDYGDFVLPLEVSEKLIKGEEVTVVEAGVAGLGLIPAGKLLGKAAKLFKGLGGEILEAFVKKVDNQATHLTDLDLQGAVKDVFGNPVVINGKTFNHLKEVQDALHGLGKQLSNLSSAIDEGKLTGEVLEQAKRLRTSLQKQKDKIQNVLNKAEKQANELTN